MLRRAPQKEKRHCSQRHLKCAEGWPLTSNEIRDARSPGNNYLGVPYPECFPRDIPAPAARDELALVAGRAMLRVDVVHRDFEHVVAADTDAMDFHRGLVVRAGPRGLGRLLGLLRFAHGGILARSREAGRRKPVLPQPMRPFRARRARGPGRRCRQCERGGKGWLRPEVTQHCPCGRR